ncbi:MAG: hypothetical protein KDC67_05060, partial [Ignavibacteriae bacterium]|nr:hypothetical protein [Ignavibacteriota bacterium]
LVEPYLERASGKIEIRDYIPRLELLNVLSKMDFVLNINNNISTQQPSKLIDYHLTQRPILSIDSMNINKRAINQFLKGDYTNQYKINNVDQYRIENVCSSFLNLLD